jgi:hypothetical protein
MMRVPATAPVRAMIPLLPGVTKTRRLPYPSDPSLSLVIDRSLQSEKITREGAPPLRS